MRKLILNAYVKLLHLLVFGKQMRGDGMVCYVFCKILLIPILPD